VAEVKIKTAGLTNPGPQPDPELVANGVMPPAP
jgi:hypothetical protein